MSAFVVDKQHIDLMVSAALHALPVRLSWWRTDEDGNYAGWRELNQHAETMEDDNYKAYYTPSQLGQMLVNENVRSVHHRYPDTDPDEGDMPGPIDAYYMAPYVYAMPRKQLTAGEVFRAIDCLDYQSCEHEGWRASEAFAFCTALRKAYCDQIAEVDEAAWEHVA